MKSEDIKILKTLLKVDEETIQMAAHQIAWDYDLSQADALKWAVEMVEKGLWVLDERGSFNKKK